jgi:hypothetical protein
MRIRDGDSSDPGSGLEKRRIRDKHPGSATLLVLTCYFGFMNQNRDYVLLVRTYQLIRKSHALNYYQV